jgi:2'-5' RNA ligase
MKIDKGSWLAGQQKVFDNFKSTEEKVLTSGMTADPVLTSNQGGYIIGLIPEQQFLEKLFFFGKKVKSIAPEMFFYQPENTHSTLFTRGVASDLKPSPADNDLCEVARSIARTGSQVHVDYTKFMLNSTSLILGGVPEDAYFENLNKAEDSFPTDDLGLKRSWGAHITCGRASATIDPMRVKALLGLLDRPLNLLCRFEEVFVGSYTTTIQGFVLNITERHTLGH